MKVISYLASVPSKNSNRQKTDLLHYFCQGVNKSGDTGIIHPGNNLIDCDVAVIQGWVYSQIATPHLKLRYNVINKQKLSKKHVCVADANLFLYANKSNPFGYLRYSFDGIFPTTGIYFDKDVDESRWNKISKDTNIALENKKLGSDIVICAQRNGGWSMGEVQLVPWVIDVVAKLRNYTDRRIILRPHPGDKTAKNWINDPRLISLKQHKNMQISEVGTPLSVDLKNCYAVVNHNSSSIVGPLIQGYHAFITDPQKSQCLEVANSDFSKIESPDLFDRLKWLQRISMFHWKFEELQNGSAWAHMRNYVRQ